jgi:hypothetical protein
MNIIPARSPEPSQPDQDVLFEMANLYPKTTGLPMTVWVSPRGHPQHDARVKVCRVPGNRMVIEDTAVVSALPRPEVVEGPLDQEALDAVSRWIDLNRDVLIEHGDGTADTADLIQRLRRV